MIDSSSGDRLSKKLKPSWIIYILRCADGSLYTGITVDIKRRFQEHSDSARGAKYLRGRGPLELVFQYEVADRSRASKLEILIKQFSKQQKEDLLEDLALLDPLLEKIDTNSVGD